MGNVYLPARAGELLRSAFLGEKKRAWNQLHPCYCPGGADFGCNRAGADRLHILALAGEYIALAGERCPYHGAGRPIGAGCHRRRAVPGKIDSAPVWVAAPARQNIQIRLESDHPFPGWDALPAKRSPVVDIYPADRRHLVGGCSGWDHRSSDHLTDS